MKELLMDYERLYLIEELYKIDPIRGEYELESFIFNSGFSIEELEERGFYCFGTSNKEEWKEVFWHGYHLRFHILPESEELKIYREFKKIDLTSGFIHANVLRELREQDLIK